MGTTIEGKQAVGYSVCKFLQQRIPESCNCCFIFNIMEEVRILVVVV
jgi:hypothetical protein